MSNGLIKGKGVASKSMPEPKWLNRRAINPGLGLEEVLVAPVPEEEEEKKKRWFLFLLLFFLLGAAIATPVAILTTKVDVIGGNGGTPIDPVEPPVIVTPQENIEDFSFSLKGWQPSTDNNRYYLVNRPDVSTGDDFQSKTLSLASGDEQGRDRTELQTTNNQNITSEYFSYSVDLERKTICEADLLTELTRRSNLPEGDSDRIRIPSGYSLTKLHNRLKGTYCTYFKRTRNQVINEIKNPYVKSPDQTITAPTTSTNASAKPIVTQADVPYKARAAWYEHDSTLLGKKGQSYLWASDFPTKYINRWKPADPKDTKLIRADDQLDGWQNFSPLLSDDRAAYRTNFLYRYFVQVPYGDPEVLYTHRGVRRLKGDNTAVKEDSNILFEKSLTYPGSGSKRATSWGQRPFQNYVGDVGFPNSLSRIQYINDQFVETYEPGFNNNQRNKAIVIPEGYATNAKTADKKFYTLWNGALRAQDIATTFVKSVERRIEFTYNNANVRVVNSEIKPTDFATYMVRAAFDNSRNRALNNNFSPWANDTSANSRYSIFDAATHGKRAGLGRFTYDVGILDKEATRGVANSDHEIWFQNMYESELTNICKNSVAGTLDRELCPTTKENVKDKVGNNYSVYTPPSVDNVGTKYYAELLEINELWDYIIGEFSDILKNDKYNDLTFTESNNFVSGETGTQQTRNERIQDFNDFVQGTISTATFNKNNFKVIDALVDLFGDKGVFKKLTFGGNDVKHISREVKDQATSLMNILSLSVSALSEWNVLNDDGQYKVATYKELESAFNDFIKALVNFIDFYAVSEATRKLNAEYTINITNKDGVEFRPSIKGSRLPYLHYVRYMKMAEARRDHADETIGIFKLTKEPTYTDNQDLINWIAKYAGLDREVKVSQATDSELAYYVIHNLKDQQFPWVPVEYKQINLAAYIGAVNQYGFEDSYIGAHDTKFDEFLTVTEDYINVYMDNMYIYSEGVVRRVLVADGSTFPEWKSFDVIKPNIDLDRRLSLSVYTQKIGSKPHSITSKMFASYDEVQQGFSDLMYYTQDTLLKVGNGIEGEVTTHCLVTYNETPQKTDPGYIYTWKPLLQDTDTSDPSKLLSYFRIPEPGSDEESTTRQDSHYRIYSRSHKNPQLAFPDRFASWGLVWKDITINGDTQRRLVYTAKGGNPKIRQVEASKIIHIFFSECFSDEQYKNPVQENDARNRYQTDRDEWHRFTKEYDLKIKWDSLDKT